MSLAWQATREARAAWPYLALLGLGLPAAVAVSSRVLDSTTAGLSLPLMLNLVVALLAGVGVFHAEHRGRASRFLAHHGVRPALIWPIKVLAWLPGLAGIGLLLVGLVMLGLFKDRGGPSAAGPDRLAYAIALAGCFAVGLLGGMAIRRGITAALVAALTLSAAAVPIGALAAAGLMSWWWTATLPVALLAVSWAWTGPWLLDRPGPGRWLRLAGMLGVAAALLLPLYAGIRAWGVPDGGPIPADLRRRLAEAPVPADQDAAPLYVEAARELVPMRRALASGTSGLDGGPGAATGTPPNKVISSVIQFGWDPRAEAPPAWLEKNARVLDLIRGASTRRRARFGSLEGLTLFGRDTRSGIRNAPPRDPLARLVALSARRKQHHGDLGGAWDDLMVLFRMSRQQVEPMTTAMAMDSFNIETMALGLAMAWALDAGQTPGLLRDARGGLLGLGAPPDPRLVIAAEQRVAEQTLDRARSTLRDEVLGVRLGASPRANLTAEAWASAVTTPWEVERARRAFRTLFARARSDLEQGLPATVDGGPMGRLQESRILMATPLVGWLFPPIHVVVQLDRQNEVARRALVQIVALRAWQLAHDGRLPGRLEDLVPSELDRLPDDPFRPGVPFQYVRKGELPRGGWLAEWNALGDRDAVAAPAAPHSASRLLYSIGPDRVDNNGTISPYSPPTFTGDTVFPLPEAVQVRR